MLFRSNRRRYQFYLYKLSDLEHAEITNLITTNGGEVCANDKYPAIRLSNCENYDGGDPVFHINYIRECLERQRLLDLINFKIGAQGYYGCLMSILVHGKNICLYDENTDSCCSSSQLKSSQKYHHPIIEDQTSGRGDSNGVQENGAENNFTIKKWWSPPDTPLQDSQFISLRSLSDSEFLPGSTQQSTAFLPEEARRDSEFIPAEWPRDSKFSPKKSRQSLERLPAVAPGDSEFFPQESQSSIKTIMIERIRERFSKAGQIEFASKVPEPVRFEELNYDPNIPRAEQSRNESITLGQNSCPMVSESVTNVDDIVKRNEEISLRLERLKMTKLKTLNCAKSRRTSRKLFAENIAVDGQPVSGGWKTRPNPTILRDEHNQVKILGENGGLYNIVKRHELTSNIDNTNHNPTAARGVDSKQKVLRKRITSPRLESNTDVFEEDGEVAKVSNNDKITIQPSEFERKSKNNSQTSAIPVNTSKVTKHKGNTAISATRSFGRRKSIIDSDSDTASEVETASTVSPKRNVREAAHRVTRNFNTWEQREMINYLIDNRQISEGRGIAVWKQMIDDGYLTHRTPFSLNNHFRRIILPNIHRFKLKHNHMSEFESLVKKKSEHRKNSK